MTIRGGVANFCCCSVVESDYPYYRIKSDTFENMYGDDSIHMLDVHVNRRMILIVLSYVLVFTVGFLAQV
jgi:hypothetical protein